MNLIRAGALVTLLLACTAPKAPGQTDLAPSAIPAVVATVNGENITGQEWLTRLQGLGFNDFNQSIRARALTAGQLALDSLISERLVEQYAAKVGLTPSDAEVNAAVETRKATPAIRERLDKKLLTEDQLRKAVRYQRVLQAFATVNQSATEAEIRSWFDNLYGARWQFAMLRSANKANADAAYAELGKGATFASVVEKYSEDPETKKAGGELRGADGKARWFTAREMAALPAFVGASVSRLAKSGDYTPVIEQSGPDGRKAYFILRLVGSYKASDEEYKRMRPQVEREALFAKAMQSGAAERKLIEVRKGAKVTVSLPGYESLAVTGG